jgi:hypothetical protein
MDDIFYPVEIQKDKISQVLSYFDVAHIQINLWICSNDSRSNIHYDMSENILVVLSGTKSVRLYPPDQTQFLYPQPVHEPSMNHSLVDLDNPGAFPLFSRATGSTYHLGPGDALRIPEGSA